MTFQDIIFKLQEYWSQQGCLIVQAYDTEKGAGTFSPHTFFNALGSKSCRVAYAEPCRRPADGRYGKNPNRAQHYFQFQVILKPSPDNVLELYMQSLQAIGIQRQDHDFRFVEDNWESPTLGAWGVGWEVWMDGMEITQFTYFQQCGGFDCQPVTVEMTYGLERLAMYLQKKNNLMDIVWHRHDTDILYKDIYLNFELDHCAYNFEKSDPEKLRALYQIYEEESHRLSEEKLLYPAYEFCLKCSHIFNLLDARGIISVSQRPHYILGIRKLARKCASLYLEKTSELSS